MKRTDATTSFVLLSVLIACANWYGMLRWFISKKHFPVIPILCGVLGVWHASSHALKLGAPLAACVEISHPALLCSYH